MSSQKECIKNKVSPIYLVLGICIIVALFTSVSEAAELNQQAIAAFHGTWQTLDQSYSFVIDENTIDGSSYTITKAWYVPRPDLYIVEYETEDGLYENYMYNDGSMKIFKRNNANHVFHDTGKKYMKVAH